MSGKSGRGARRRAALPECLSILSGGNGLSGVLDENNCEICSLELRYGVMVALQILVLSAQVRILVPQLSLRGISPDPCACAASAFFQPQSLRDSPFQGQAGSGGASAGRLRCFDVCDISLTLRRAACAAPAGVAFRLCVAKSRDRAGALMSTFSSSHSAASPPGVSAASMSATSR